MTIDIDAAPASDPSAEHDHAWRKLPGAHEDIARRRVPLRPVPAVWSL